MNLIAPNEFGQLLKDGRRLRGRSQLNLALDAEVSSRHLSCTENGRSKPSREMVLRAGGITHESHTMSGTNMMRLTLHPDGLKSRLENWHEVAEAALSRAPADEATERFAVESLGT